MDINRSIRIAVDTGKVSFGAETSKTALMNKQAKLVIVAQNCPAEIKEDVNHYATLSKIPILDFKGSSLDLGEICGRPHFVAVLTVYEIGDSDILKAVKK
ncbi:MAG: 50S ribosomal protein L30e [Candidatus Heimdallarchaeota archaeon]|nr:50S ribosomal protein L30e [Candidatus Heimdallarchaeota archaeon]MCK4768756.1 50S ribosomal protein L30e [Candidatus Heimdallarchaeota archaeon]